MQVASWWLLQSCLCQWLQDQLCRMHCKGAWWVMGAANQASQHAVGCLRHAAASICWHKYVICRFNVVKTRKKHVS